MKDPNGQDRNNDHYDTTFDGTLDATLEAIGLTADSDRRELLRTLPSPTAPLTTVVEWATRVAAYRNAKIDQDKITWRGSDLDKCIGRVQNMYGKLISPSYTSRDLNYDGLIFNHQETLPLSIKMELAGDVAEMVHIRKAMKVMERELERLRDEQHARDQEQAQAANRARLRGQRTTTRTNSLCPIILVVLLVVLVTLLYRASLSW